MSDHMVIVSTPTYATLAFVHNVLELVPSGVLFMSH